jgi:hypothetical protein
LQTCNVTLVAENPSLEVKVNTVEPFEPLVGDTLNSLTELDVRTVTEMLSLYTVPPYVKLAVIVAEPPLTLVNFPVESTVTTPVSEDFQYTVTPEGTFPDLVSVAESPNQNPLLLVL